MTARTEDNVFWGDLTTTVEGRAFRWTLMYRDDGTIVIVGQHMEGTLVSLDCLRRMLQNQAVRDAIQRAGFSLNDVAVPESVLEHQEVIDMGERQLVEGFERAP